MNKIKFATIVNLCCRFKLCAAIGLIIFTPIAVADCSTPTTSEYEKIYCKVVSEGAGRSLPAFEDFKRNDPVVQHLLLKRPAAKLKLALPALDRSREQYTRKSRTAERSNNVLSTSRTANNIPQSEIAAAPATERVIDGLSSCRVGRSQVSCSGKAFQLRTNRANKFLKKGVLHAGNTMDIPEYFGDMNNSIEVQYYLTKAYGVYIRKMLDIGLGGSTMSYSRFYHTFYDLQAKAVSFSDRFETMYRYLKKDKTSMAVAPLLSNHRPNSIVECDQVDQSIVVCDSGGFNWVYVN